MYSIIGLRPEELSENLKWVFSYKRFRDYRLGRIECKADRLNVSVQDGLLGDREGTADLQLIQKSLESEKTTKVYIELHASEGERKAYRFRRGDDVEMKMVIEIDPEEGSFIVTTNRLKQEDYDDFFEFERLDGRLFRWGYGVYRELDREIPNKGVYLSKVV